MILYHGSNMEVIDIDTFLAELKYKKGVTFQYFFATERSIKYLKRV